MAGQKIGYARVAASSPEIDMQVERLREAGCSIVFTDNGASGLSPERPGLMRAFAAIGAGDTLVVCDMARLARDPAALGAIANKLSAVGARHECLDVWAGA